MKNLSLMLLFLGMNFSMAQSLNIAKTVEGINPLTAGEFIPKSTVYDAEGNRVSSEELFKGKPSILIIYRGGWCPFCTNHLAEIADKQKKLKRMGYNIYAISPDIPSEIKKLEKSNAYEVYSDQHFILSNQLGLLFEAPDGYKKMLLEKTNNLNKGYIPAPAVYIISKDGKILFEDISLDFRDRISGKELLKAAKLYK